MRRLIGRRVIIHTSSYRDVKNDLLATLAALSAKPRLRIGRASRLTGRARLKYALHRGHLVEQARGERPRFIDGGPFNLDERDGRLLATLHG